MQTAIAAMAMATVRIVPGGRRRNGRINAQRSPEALATFLLQAARIARHLINDESVVALEPAIGKWSTLTVDTIEVPQEIGLEVRGWLEAFVRPGKLLAGSRPDHVWRDDHDQLCLLLDEVPAAKERAEYRDVLQAGQTIDVLSDVVGDESGKRKRTARRQLHRRFGLSLSERRDRDAVEGHGALVRQLAHLSLDFQADASLRKHHWSEGKPDPELLEGHGKCALAVDDRNRELATGEKLGGLAGNRREVRLGERPHEAVALERPDRSRYGIAAPAPAALGPGIAERVRCVPRAEIVERERRLRARCRDGRDGQTAKAGGGRQRQRILRQHAGDEVA